MDFMSDELYNGRRIRLLTLVDNFTRENLAIEVAGNIGGHRVVETLMCVVAERELPEKIRVDNGPEFISKILDQWAYLNCALIVCYSNIKGGTITGRRSRWW